MSQQKDWVRPSAVAPMADDPPAAAPAAPLRVSPPAPKRARPAPASENAGEIVIDEDLDLKDIAELAKRIERRTP
jgi:hypothetical protein